MPDVQLQSGESLRMYQHQHSPYSQAARQERKRKKKEKALWILQSELFTFSIQLIDCTQWKHFTTERWIMSALFLWQIPGVVTLNAWANRHMRWKWDTLWEMLSPHFSDFLQDSAIFSCGEKKNKTQQFHHKACDLSTWLLFFLQPFFFFYSRCLILAKHHQFI